MKARAIPRSDLRASGTPKALRDMSKLLIRGQTMDDLGSVLALYKNFVTCFCEVSNCSCESKKNIRLTDPTRSLPCPLLPFAALYCSLLTFAALYLPFTALLLPFTALYLSFTALYCPLLLCTIFWLKPAQSML